MAILSREQVVGLCAQVGLNRGQIPIAGAICDAESGRNTNAVGENVNDHGRVWSRDRGLWQINDVYHPDVSDGCAFDPFCNAQAMFRISHGGTNWNPWSTYTSGAYRNYLPAWLTILGGNPVNPPAAGVDLIGHEVTMIRQGMPVQKAILLTLERAIDQVKQAGFNQAPGTGLGSGLF